MPNQPPPMEPLKGEEAIIAVLAPLTQGYPGAFGLKDDCALLSPPAGRELVLKIDPLAEGVHFLSGASPRDVAWRALAANVSDLAAKGAEPLCYLLALSFPEPPTTAWMTEFVEGLRAAQTEFRCYLAGGDTDRRPGPLTVTITIIGSVPQGRMVPRGGAKVGDLLYVSGSIGDAALGLELLNKQDRAHAWGLTESEAEELRQRFLRPQPRLQLTAALLDCASAAMDLSDGLVKDLERMLRASGVAGRLVAGDVPLSGPGRKVVALAPERLGRLITAGDDYELLVAVPPRNVKQFEAAAAAAEVPVTQVGNVFRGKPDLVVVGADGTPVPLPERTGWDHF